MERYKNCVSCARHSGRRFCGCGSQCEWRLQQCEILCGDTCHHSNIAKLGSCWRCHYCYRYQLRKPARRKYDHLNGTQAAPSAWSNSSINVPVPVGASNGPIVVTVNGFATNGMSFYVTPNILNLQPPNGPVGTQVTITGNGFGQSQNVVSGVSFNGVSATIGTWSDTGITATVPSNATTGNVMVTTAANLASSGVNFTVGVAPTITSLSPSA